MLNIHLITVKYLEPTNTRDARLKFTSRYQRKSFTLDHNDTFSASMLQYVIYGLLQNMGYRVVLCASTDGKMIDTFGVITKAKDQGSHSWIPMTPKIKTWWDNADSNTALQYRKIVLDFNELVDHVDDDQIITE